MEVRSAPPEALEWPSIINAGVWRYERTYAELSKLHPEGASRWRVATLAAEQTLSDGYFDDSDKWFDRADRIDAAIRAGSY